MNEKYKFIIGSFLGIMLAGIIIAAEIKIKNNQSVNLKKLFLITVLIGFAMCCIGKAVHVNGWTNPFVIICILLGIALLLLTIFFLTGRFKFDDLTSLRILYSLILIKWLLTTIHHITNFIK